MPLRPRSLTSRMRVLTERYGRGGYQPFTAEQRRVIREDGYFRKVFLAVLGRERPSWPRFPPPAA